MPIDRRIFPATQALEALTGLKPPQPAPSCGSLFAIQDEPMAQERLNEKAEIGGN